MSCYFFFSSRRRHTRFSRDWSSDVCSSDLMQTQEITNLVSARAKTDDMGMNIRTTREGANQKVVINAQPTAKTKKSNTVLVDLHPEVLWNIQLNYGAATISNDIAALRFKHLEVNTGASKMTLTLGVP